MKRAKYIERYESHKAMMERMKADGSLNGLYKSNKPKWEQLYRRLGYLEEAVKSKGGE